MILELKSEENLSLSESLAFQLKEAKNEIKVLKSHIKELEDKYQFLDDKLTSFINQNSSRSQSIIDVNSSPLLGLTTYNLNRKNTKELVDFEELDILKNFISDPLRLDFKYFISININTGKGIDYFTVFKSLLEDTYVVYAIQTGLFSTACQIECYSLDKKKVVKQISNIPGSYLTVKHFCDVVNAKDYIISSSDDKTIRVYDIYSNWDCVTEIKKSHSKDMLTACAFINEYDNSKYIVSGADFECVKVWDFDGKFICEIGKEEEICCLNCFNDKYEKKYYVLNGNNKDVKVYDFGTKELFKAYQEPNVISYHYSIELYDKNGGYVLYESDSEGIIRLWEFRTGELRQKIQCGRILKGISIWNEEYVLASGANSTDNTIKLISIKDEKVIKDFKGHTKGVCNIRKFIHPKYGEAMISLGFDGTLKLWLKN